MKVIFLAILVVIGSAAEAKTKKINVVNEDVPDFNFKSRETPLGSSYGFQDSIHSVELVQTSEADESKPLEPFKEIEGEEIDDNFNVSSKRKPASVLSN